MPPFTKLLVVAADAGGSTAVMHATRLAAATHASITLVHVMERVPALVRWLLPRHWNIRELIRDHRDALIRRAAARIRRLGLPQRVSLLEGRAGQALAVEVTRGGHDLLIVGTPTTGTGGADAAELVRACPCPILVAMPARRRRPRVLAALDVGPLRSPSSDGINAAIIEHALWMARTQKGTLHVLYVVESSGEGLLRRAGVTEPTLRATLAQDLEQARLELRNAVHAQGAAIDDRHLHLTAGDPRQAIGDFATRHRIDLLVMGTAARSGLAAHLIGNTAEAVVAHPPCSTLVVRRPPEVREAASAGNPHAPTVSTDRLLTLLTPLRT